MRVAHRRCDATSATVQETLHTAGTKGVWSERWREGEGTRVPGQLLGGLAACGTVGFLRPSTTVVVWDSCMLHGWLRELPHTMCDLLAAMLESLLHCGSNIPALRRAHEPTAVRRSLTSPAASSNAAGPPTQQLQASCLPHRSPPASWAPARSPPAAGATRMIVLAFSAAAAVTDLRTLGLARVVAAVNAKSRCCGRW